MQFAARRKATAIRCWRQGADIARSEELLRRRLAAREKQASELTVAVESHRTDLETSHRREAEMGLMVSSLQQQISAMQSELRTQQSLHEESATQLSSNRMSATQLWSPTACWVQLDDG